MPEFKQKNGYFIYFAAVSANLLSLSLGASFSWSAILLPQLESNDTSINPLESSITSVNSKYMVSSTNGVASIAAILGAVGIEMLGKKKTLLLVGLPLLLSHSLCTFGKEYWYFIVARVLMGLSTGSFFGAMTSYTADVSEDKNRGFFICLMTVFISFGGLLAYIVGQFTSIKVFSCINLIPIVLFYITFGLFVPESPYDLLKKDFLEEARRSLGFFRGEISDKLNFELLDILFRVKLKRKIQDPSKLCKLMRVFGATMVFNGFLIFHQSNGMMKIVTCSEAIFNNYNDIIIATIALFSAILSVSLVDKLGRKKLLVIAFYFVGVSIFTFITQIVFKLLDYDNYFISWIAIISLLTLIVAHNLVGSIPWLLVTEVFSFNIRDVECALVSFITFTISFAILTLFPELESALGLYNALFGLEIMIGVSFMFFLLSIPETRGKCFEEIW